MWITINHIPVNTSNMEAPFLKVEKDGTCSLLLFDNDRIILNVIYDTIEEATESMKKLLWNINNLERLNIPPYGNLYNLTVNKHES